MIYLNLRIKATHLFWTDKGFHTWVNPVHEQGGSFQVVKGWKPIALYAPWFKTKKKVKK